MSANPTLAIDPARRCDANADVRSAARARVSVVILNYRTPQLVFDCVRSLQGEIDACSDQIVVVDNFSQDGSAEWIEQAGKRVGWGDVVRVVRGSRNDGFSAGNNLGIRCQEADFYWLLNSDTIVRPGALRRLMSAMASHPCIGAIGPTLIWPDGEIQPSCFAYHSPLSELSQSAQLQGLSRLLRLPATPTVGFSEAQICADETWISFASVLLRDAAIRAVGPMDEGYFMYFEDVDYCRRLQSAGWKLAIAPPAQVVHLRGGSSPVKSITARRGRRPRYYYASRSRYLAKFYRRRGLILANALWWGGRLLSLPRDLLRMRTPTACRSEWLDIWTNLLNPLGSANR